MQRSSFRIDMLGTSFSIAANESPEYLEKISKIVKEKSDEVRESTGLHDPLKIAIITGIVLCDELERLKRGESPEGAKTSSTDANMAKNRAEQDLAENLALELIERLDIVLKEIEPEEEARDFEEEDCEDYDFDNEEEVDDFDEDFEDYDFDGEENDDEDI